MTPLAAAALFVALGHPTVAAQAPKPPVAALEGVWREPLLSGEKAGEKMSVTFAGEEITLVLNGEVYRGTLRADPDRDAAFVRFTITLTDGRGEKTGRTHNGRCLMKSDQLFLQVNPYPANSRRDGSSPLGLAPITFRLEKVKK